MSTERVTITLPAEVVQDIARREPNRSRFVLDQNEWQEFTDGLERPADVRPELADLLSRPRPE